MNELMNESINCAYLLLFFCPSVVGADYVDVSWVQEETGRRVWKVRDLPLPCEGYNTHARSAQNCGRA